MHVSFTSPRKYEGTHWDVLAATGTDSGGSGERAGGAALCQSLVLSSYSLLTLGRTVHAEEAPLYTCARLSSQRAAGHQGTG